MQRNQNRYNFHELVPHENETERESNHLSNSTFDFLLAICNLQNAQDFIASIIIINIKYCY